MCWMIKSQLPSKGHIVICDVLYLESYNAFQGKLTSV